MNDNAKKWLEALRSGEYKQTVKRLRAKLEDGTYGYCCLGVACDEYHEATGKGGWESTPDDSFFVVGDDRGCAVLIPPVMEWLGLVSYDGYLGDSCTLASLNDAGCSFEEIADEIEKNEHILFEKEDVGTV